MHDYFDKYSKLIPVAMIALLLILGVSVAFSVTNKKGSGSIYSVNKETDTDINDNINYDGNFLGVIKDINTEINAISIMDINGNSEVVVYFNGGTDIRDKYDKVMSISQIVLGEMVDVYYKKDTNKLVKLQISKEAWEYKGVENFSIYSPDKIIQIAESKYQFNDRLVIAGVDKLINLIDINDKDELTIKGVDEKIWSIIVTKGHGYIRLSNYDDFIEGSVEVGYHIILPVVADMLIVAREGDYKITLEKGKLKGSKHINVLRDQEVLVDMSEYRNEVEKVGNIDFLIQPMGALLYIDGEEVEYEDPIELLYGVHVIKVSLGGYSTYSGILNVDESSKVVEIDLAQEKVSEELTDTTTPNSSDLTNNKGDTNTDESGDTTPSEEVKEEDADSNENTTTEITKVDNEHTITVKQPEGTEVYLNGVLKGTVPCSFAKEIGTHTITFAKGGYVTKSYTVLVADDSKDVTFSFPDMEALQ